MEVHTSTLNPDITLPDDTEIQIKTPNQNTSTQISLVQNESDEKPDAKATLYQMLKTETSLEDSPNQALASRNKSTSS